MSELRTADGPEGQVVGSPGSEIPRVMFGVWFSAVQREGSVRLVAMQPGGFCLAAARAENQMPS